MEKRKLIKFHFVLKDPQGAILESTRGKEPMVFVPGLGQLVDSLEKELINMNRGDVKSIKVNAPLGDEVKSENITLTIQKSQLPSQNVKEGDTFLPNINPHSEPFTVVKIEGNLVTLEGKNPLGAAELTLDVEVIENRDATNQEINTTLLFNK